MAVLALVKPLAGVGGHAFFLDLAAARAGQGGLEDRLSHLGYLTRLHLEAARMPDNLADERPRGCKRLGTVPIGCTHDAAEFACFGVGMHGGVAPQTKQPSQNPGD